MGRYPEVISAVPTNFVTPTRTAKVLTPEIIFTTCVILAVASIGVLTVTSLLFGSGESHSSGTRAAQSLLLISALLSLFYLSCHSAAIISNEPVGVIRPPVLRIHAICFIAIRLALLAWLISMIASAVVASKSKVCLTGDQECDLQIVNIVGSALAFLTTGVLITALESCHYPFKLPDALDFRLVTCRVSAFGDDIATLDRSVSQTSLRQEKSTAPGVMIRVPGSKSSEIKRKPLPERPIYIPGEWPTHTSEPSEPLDQPIIPEPATVRRSRSRGWGEDWTHAEEMYLPKKNINPTDSAISMARYENYSRHARNSSGITRSSTGYARSSSGYASTSEPESSPRGSLHKKHSRIHSVTPSSSISNFSRRSPLSTMRSIDLPELAIRPELHYLPPSQRWRYARTSSLPQLSPVADIHTLQRRVSSTPSVPILREAKKPLPPIPGSPATRRKGKKSKPGTIAESYHDTVLDGHMRKIEMASIRRRDSRPLLQYAGPANITVASNTREGSMTSQTDQVVNKGVQTMRRANTTGTKDTPGSTHTLGTALFRTGELRRLSLGDITSSFGRF